MAKPTPPPVQGFVAPGFEPVREAFVENLTERNETGGAFHAVLDGEVVADLWGGWADREQRVPWEPETRVLVFSATKGLVAAAFLRLAALGRLSYEDPVAAAWPELEPSLGELSIAAFLEHRSGLIAVDERLKFEDLAPGNEERVAELLARQRPAWLPGEQQGYAPVAWGLYAAELFRRLAGEPLQLFVRRELLAPLKADLALGCEDSQELGPLAKLYPIRLMDVLVHVLPRVLGSPGPEGRTFRRVLILPGSATWRAFRSYPRLGRAGLARYAQPEVLRLGLAWCGAVASARGLARLYQPLAGDGRWQGQELLRPHDLAALRERRSWGDWDKVLNKPLGFSYGFLKDETHLLSPNPASFGHPGMGGSTGFCDPDRRLAIGYVMNRMDFRVRSPRCLALYHALYDCLPGGAQGSP